MRACRSTASRNSPFTERPNQISRGNGKRRSVVTANVRSRDLGSVVEEAQAKVAQGGAAAAGLLDDLGRPVREPRPRRASATCDVVVPACFAMVFLLLLAAMGSARDALLVFSAVPLALTGGIAGAVAARHAVLDLGSGRLHRAVRRGSAGTGW